MTFATQLLQTSATSIRALFEPDLQQLLEQSSDSYKSGHAREQALLVIDCTALAEDPPQENDINQIRDFMFSLLARLVSRATLAHTEAESRNRCHAQSRSRNYAAGLLGSC